MVPRHILAVTRQLVLTCIKKEEKVRKNEKRKEKKKKQEEEERRSKWPTLFVKGWSGLPSG